MVARHRRRTLTISTSFYVVADFRTANARADQEERCRAVRRRAARVAVEGAALRTRATGGHSATRVYDVIARTRYRIFGRYEQCLITERRISKSLRRVARRDVMKVVIPGGSGQVGTVLARAFHGDGHDVVVLSRRLPLARGASLPGMARPSASGRSEIDGCDVVINLAGRSVNCRYTAANRRGDPAVARVVDARCGTGDRERVAPAARVAAGEHRHDLCASIRQSERRALGHSRRRRTRCARHRGDSASTSHAHGKRAFDEAVTDRNSEGRASVGDDVESGPWRHLRHAHRPGSPRPRRQRR